MKKTNNKGFSLVELIIVVAIMAVLVGVLAPQYIKYLDKSKAGTDRQMLDNLRQAITTTILDPDLSDPTDDGAPSIPTTWTSIDDASIGSTADFWEEVFEIMGVDDGADLIDELAYKVGSGSGADIKFSINSNKNVGVRIIYDGTYGTDKYDFEIE
ncbi:MAG: prepilin-type N-terminal cleavage/methylation domain-containing protein [Lachnospiraceae bacterium]|nr:prepilin-type N-terminal cleavage/methylation domain-containing protein [Lachnospiraceae bacterium]